MKIQMTLFSEKYKPISTIIKVESAKDFRENFKTHRNKAITNICIKRFWDLDDLKYYGYELSSLKYRKVEE